MSADECIPPRVQAALNFLSMTKEYARPQRSIFCEGEVAGAVPRAASEIATERQAFELLRLYFAGETDAGPVGRACDLSEPRPEPTRATSETHVG